MALRNYSSVAAETTLQAGINNVSTVILVASTLGFPVAPFTLALDYGAATEEVVDVTNVAGLSLTITRAVDGTAATDHGAGARVRHVSSARDFREANEHINTNSGVHGTTGDVVGEDSVQTLTNKTLDSPAFTGTTVGGIDVGGTIEAPTVIIGEAPAFAGVLTVNGSAAVEAGMVITTNSGIGTHLEVEKSLGSTGSLQEWTGVGGTPVLAVVDGNGKFDSTSSDVTTTSLLTASAGWSIAGTTIGVVKNGAVTINGNVTRTGANITINAAGAPSTGIVGMATINAQYRPKASLAITYHHAGNSIATGTVRINTATTGLVELVRLQASQTITTGDTLSFTITYPLS
jgi:hypothetical protein